MPYKNIDSRIWNDEKFISLNSEQQIFFIYLITNDRSNLIGGYVTKLGYISADLGWTEEEIILTINQLQNKNFIKWNREKNIIVINNFLKYNQIRGQKQLGCAVKRYNELPECEQIVELGEKIKELCINYGYPIDTISIGYPDNEIDTEYTIDTIPETPTTDTLSIGYPEQEIPYRRGIIKKKEKKKKKEKDSVENHFHSENEKKSDPLLEELFPHLRCPSRQQFDSAMIRIKSEFPPPVFEDAVRQALSKPPGSYDTGSIRSICQTSLSRFLEKDILQHSDTGGNGTKKPDTKKELDASIKELEFRIEKINDNSGKENFDVSKFIQERESIKFTRINTDLVKETKIFKQYEELINKFTSMET